MDWFVGGDRRAYWAVEYLRKNGLQLGTHAVPGQEDQPLPETFDRLFLPMTPTGEIEELLCRLREGSQVIGGRLGKSRESIEATGASVTELYDTEPLTTLNAVATAEGALAVLIRKSEITLWESSCLVIGAGRIGMRLAELLRDLGARVTVSARSPKDLALIRSRALSPERTGQYHRGLGQYDYIINTVPAEVLDAQQLKEVKKSCLLLELASAPGGFSMEVCQALGLKGISAPGLPGEFSPKTAGEIYGEAILNRLKGEGDL